MEQRTRRTTFGVGLGAVALLLGPFIGGTWADAVDGPGGASAAQVTEDNDTNDGGTPNNVVDDGDNRHPSGRDRSVEPGGSGNQGDAQHDPDDDGNGPDRSNGGADKPDGPGGVDLADQDGNNGCGNDDDFEDDNEGLCRGRQAESPPPGGGGPGGGGPGGGGPGGGGPGGGGPAALPRVEVLSEVVTAPAASAPTLAQVAPAAAQAAPAAAPAGELAFTGDASLALTTIGVAAIAVGWLLTGLTRRRAA